MSSFLISTMPATGHVNPAMPVVTELVRRGHAVTWHTGVAYAAAVKATGATFEPFTRTPDFEQIPIAPDVGTTGRAAGISVMRRLFIDRVAGQVADYERILGDRGADALMADMCCLGAATLRDRGGPPFATLGINPLVTPDPEIPPFGTGWAPASSWPARARNRVMHWLIQRFFLSALKVLLDAERARLGLSPLGRNTSFADVQRSPFLHLMPTTPAFEYPRHRLAPQIHFVGPLIPAPLPSFTPPPWWSELAGRRVVHVTQGTYATDSGRLVRPTMAALAELDVLVVVTTPRLETLIGPPANVRAAPFIPHAHLLPRTDVMVTNGGYNGVLTALAHGVPLVCAGRSEDKADVGARVAWSGAGLDLKTDTPSPERIRQAVIRVLQESTFRHNALRIQADFQAHRPAEEAATLLERLAASGQPVVG